MTDKDGFDMVEYLDRVPLSARPLSFGPVPATLKKEVQEYFPEMQKFATTAKEYKASCESRVSKELRDKSQTWKAWEVPFDCRPWMDGVDDGVLDYMPLSSRLRCDGFQSFQGILLHPKGQQYQSAPSATNPRAPPAR